MQLFFTHTEDEETATDGQPQSITLKIKNRAEGIGKKAEYSKIFKGQSSIITNNHKEKKSCTKEVI